MASKTEDEMKAKVKTIIHSHSDISRVLWSQNFDDIFKALPKAIEEEWALKRSNKEFEIRHCNIFKRKGHTTKVLFQEQKFNKYISFIFQQIYTLIKIKCHKTKIYHLMYKIIATTINSAAIAKSTDILYKNVVKGSIANLRQNSSTA